MVMSASAQQVSTCWMDLEKLGIEGTVDIAENTLLCEDANGAMYLAFPDAGKSFNPSGANYSQVAFNGGESAKIAQGLTGSTNPTFTSYADGAPTGGWVFKYVAKKDGVLTVLTKMNTNKQYIVFEGKQSPISYTLGVVTDKATIQYTLPADKDGYLDFKAADAEKYFIFPVDDNGNPTGEDPAKPKTPGNTDGVGNVGEGSGFLQFNVYEECEYYISALGSKLSTNGFVYSDAPISVTYNGTADGVELPEVTFKPGEGPVGAVESVEVAADENAPIYNMMGVRVSDDAKGILIQNGKKFIRK